MSPSSALVALLLVGCGGTTTTGTSRQFDDASCRLELPSVHIPSMRSREVKAACTSREQRVGMRTQVVCRGKSYVRSRLGAPLVATPMTLPTKARARLVAHPPGLPEHIDRSLAVLESLNEQIDAADDELAELAKDDECARRLMTVIFPCCRSLRAPGVFPPVNRARRTHTRALWFS